MNRCLKTIFFLFLIGNASGFYDNYTCNYCGQLVYGVVLPNDVETLISVTEMYFQYNYCPAYFSFLPLAQCVTGFTTAMSWVYRPLYAALYPVRDSICPGVCGGETGENYEIVFKKKK
ncbi:hypothetical protein GCK72_021782 [Caenorhabditis remanei]|uniref:Uncharacterized protein n=1 Tax=Caenorhabditis remanei TaxID=31234 RepID=A0A6A5GKP8_CAERE|nr:hypothetical protein GCK72_021782 [Caenorhabditis remanei]KAF1755213.1 hypothetical protein GCK72_021782 [Caenorhabditis remanei]